MEHSNETSMCNTTGCDCGTKQRARQMNMPAALLWASAFLLAALTIIQAARLPLNAAYAGAANQGGQGMSVVTQNTGLGPAERPYEALWVLDGRGEMLFIYYMENANAGEKALLLRQAIPVPDLFRTARGG
ncbi:MAG TPA: hypothetical protein DCR70_01565 [Phycisphaerales bacterium]|jgi:hypothetical protein|nr:hypothetical protein [Phycisphaerales bacterium]